MADAAGKISLKKICISTFTIYKSFFILFFRKSYQLAHGSFLLSLDYCTKKAANHLVYNFSRIISCTFKTTYKLKSLLHPFLYPVLPSWLCPRPISNSQLHALLHFHLCPIYLVVFKGSYYLRRDISS